MLTVKEVVDILKGEVIGNLSTKILGFGDIETAKEDELSFTFTKEDIEKIKYSKSKVIICRPLFFINANKTFIFTDKTFDHCLYILANYFQKNKKTKIVESNYFGKGCIISSKSFVNENVSIGDGTKIDIGVVIESNVTIGKNCVISPNVTIKENTIIGDGVFIDSGACIGNEAFWCYTKDGFKGLVPGVKGVEIGNNVYIGANTTIGKGVLRKTKIGNNSTIGSLTAIAHDTVIGENARLVSQTGIAGQCTIGNNAMFYGQVGMADKVTVGNNVTIYAKSGVKDDIEDNLEISGIPALKHKDNLRIILKQRKEYFNGKKEREK